MADVERLAEGNLVPDHAAPGRQHADGRLLAGIGVLAAQLAEHDRRGRSSGRP